MAKKKKSEIIGVIPKEVIIDATKPRFAVASRCGFHDTDKKHNKRPRDKSYKRGSWD